MEKEWSSANRKFTFQEDCPSMDLLWLNTYTRMMREPIDMDVQKLYGKMFIEHSSLMKLFYRRSTKWIA